MCDCCNPGKGKGGRSKTTSVVSQALSYVNEIREAADIIEKAKLKRKTVKVGGFTLAGVGTGCGKLGFRIPEAKKLKWTKDKLRIFEKIGEEFGLRPAYGVYAHLEDEGGGDILAINDAGVDDILYVSSRYEKADELLEALGSRLFNIPAKG